MNPYDFVRIDWNRPPERRQPIWHHQLVSNSAKRLYSGRIEIDVVAETPLFIFDPRDISFVSGKPAQFIQNKQNEYIIPGTSLKGMLRNLVETLGNGCLKLFDGLYERGRIDYRKLVPVSFLQCSRNTALCIACRTFGMLGSGGGFLGKVNVSDARIYADSIYNYDPIFTAVLVEPKPHHRDFYLDEVSRHIAGRKYYFHHSPTLQPITAPGPIRFGKDAMANRYIQPLDYDTKFHFSLDFTNLEVDEFAALLLAISLKDDMRHKIGYGKPLGLGSIYLQPASLKLVDYSSRYMHRRSERGQTLLEGDSLWNLLSEQISNFSKTHIVKVAMEDLHRIWHWPPDPKVSYYYPSKHWFATQAGTGRRISDTKTTP